MSRQRIRIRVSCMRYDAARGSCSPTGSPRDRARRSGSPAPEALHRSLADAGLGQARDDPPDLPRCARRVGAGAIRRMNGSWDFVLAHIRIDYRRQLTQADGEIVVRCHLGVVQQEFKRSYARGREGRRDDRGRGRGGVVARATPTPMDRAHRAGAGGRCRPSSTATRSARCWVGEHPATVDRVISVPAGHQPHDRLARRPGVLEGVQRPTVR